MIFVNDDVDEDELMMIIMSFDDDREGFYVLFISFQAL